MPFFITPHTVHKDPAVWISRCACTASQLELLQTSCAHGFVVLTKYWCCGSTGCLPQGIWTLLSLTSQGTGHCRVPWPLHSARGFNKSVLYTSAQHHCSSCSSPGGGLSAVQYFLIFFFNIQWSSSPLVFSHLKSCVPLATVQFVTENGFRKGTGKLREDHLEHSTYTEPLGLQFSVTPHDWEPSSPCKIHSALP